MNIIRETAEMSDTERMAVRNSNMQCFLNEFWDKIYPIGSIYISAASTSPATLFGGTWVQIKGRFLLAAGKNDANTTTDFGSMSAGELNRPAGELGGESKHTDTVEEMPNHVHRMTLGYGDGTEQSLQYKAQGNKGNYSTFCESSGGGQPHNNMPPYLAVYVWKRTA